MTVTMTVKSMFCTVELFTLGSFSHFLRSSLKFRFVSPKLGKCFGMSSIE